MTVSTTRAHTSTATTASFADSTAAGQVLMWAPEGAGALADVAWVIAGVLGNAAGVRTVEVQLLDSGSVYATVRVNDREYVRRACEVHGWRLYAPDDSYATASTMLGEIHLAVTWLAPKERADTGVAQRVANTSSTSGPSAPASLSSATGVSGLPS